MRYYSFNSYLKNKYGVRVHRLSLNAGFTCPNRDGTLGSEGCIYCNEKGFSRFAGEVLPLDEQIEKSIKFAKDRYRAEKFIAYFQTATNTYAPLDELRKKYSIVKDFPDIVGLFISTRPDLVDLPVLDLIKTFAEDYEVWIEYGLQTAHNRTLDLINRMHTFEQSVEAINKTAARGINVAVHLIMGLPGESETDMLETIRTISMLPISGVKFHAFHVLKDTPLESIFRSGKIKLLDMHKYVDIICKSIERLRDECVILRLVSDAKDNLLVAPEWMRDKQKVIRAIELKLEEKEEFR